jgi:hypothetical protein
MKELQLPAQTEPSLWHYVRTALCLIQSPTQWVLRTACWEKLRIQTPSQMCLGIGTV